VGLRYADELEVKDISGSKVLLLTKPFNLMGIDAGEKVSVKLEDNKLTIEKVEKK